MKYHFIGIGGIGMSGIAKVLLEKGNKVSGSDLAENRQTEELKRIGAEIFHGHLAENLTTDVDFVVVSSAIKPDNPEIVQAKKLGITILNRSELLNEVITKDHKAIAVTGTHGKTTTSSMVASILEAAGFEPTAVIGAEVNALSGNAKAGQGEFSVAEVCEYKRAFLDIFPHAAVITNIEEDHLDCYKDINDIVSAFADFVTHINTDGFLVIYGEDRNIDKAIKDFKGRTIRYGQSYQNDWYLEDVNITGHETSFSVISDGNRLDRFKIIIPGFHNVLNALAAIVVTKTIGVPTSAIKDVLSKFVGAERRFQLKGEKGGVIFVDDYGHHPTEIMATLAGAREFYPDKKIIAVFQPHQHSRTRFLLEDFSKSFSDADLVLIPEIYAVRDTEKDIRSVSSKDLVEKINNIKPGKALFFKDFEQTANYLRKNTKKGDLIITIGAGPVNQVGEMVLKQ